MVTMAVTLLFFYWGKPPEISEKPPEISGNLRKTSGKFRRWRKTTEMQMYLLGPQTGNIFRSMDSLVLRHPIICSEINVRSFNSVHPLHRASENVASQPGIEPGTSCTAGEYSMKRAIQTAIFNCHSGSHFSATAPPQVAMGDCG
jgi:hypothetical protein